MDQAKVSDNDSSDDYKNDQVGQDDQDEKDGEVVHEGEAKQEYQDSED